MTREEAIQWLKRIKECHIREYEYDSRGTLGSKVSALLQINEALDMAISALQAEPKVAYACDGRRCGADCSDCGRTTDIKHAKNFTKICDSYFEKLQTEPSVSIQPKTIANNCDLISRADAINKLAKHANGFVMFNSNGTGVFDILKSLPSVSAERVVRCKDCDNRHTDDCPMYHEEWHEIDEGDGYVVTDFIVHDYSKDDGFCSWAKMKGGGE